MNWKKRGLIVAPSPTPAWKSLRVMCPTPLLLNDDVIRVYCAFSGEDQRSVISYVDVAAHAPEQVVSVGETICLGLGERGLFDDAGTLPSVAVRVGSLIYLYYFGFHLAKSVPYTIQIGLAISSDGGEHFERYSRVPVLLPSAAEPFYRSASFVMRDKGVFRMWYSSVLGWVEHNGKCLPRYDLRYIESADGLKWGEEGRVAIPLSGRDDEFGLARPHVSLWGGYYHMFFSVRSISLGYRLGYAYSRDGYIWERCDDEVGLSVSEGQEGWDTEMVCYPALVEWRDKIYCFYNGNGMGRSGFGCAELVGGVR